MSLRYLAIIRPQGEGDSYSLFWVITREKFPGDLKSKKYRFWPKKPHKKKKNPDNLKFNEMHVKVCKGLGSI